MKTSRQRFIEVAVHNADPGEFPLLNAHGRMVATIAAAYDAFTAGDDAAGALARMESIEREAARQAAVVADRAADEWERARAQRVAESQR